MVVRKRQAEYSCGFGKRSLVGIITLVLSFLQYEKVEALTDSGTDQITNMQAQIF